MTPLVVGGREIGGGAPCYVIAEVGVNHDGDEALAHRLVDLAADAGADAVKFQTFDVDSLVSASAEAAPYQRESGAADQRSMLSALTLPEQAWGELAAHAAERRTAFLSTPFDLGSAEVLAGIGVPALKVPSGELDNLPFIRALAAFGLPLLLSTGMGTLAEVAQALEAAEVAPGRALFHCVSAYPAPEEEANLRAVATLAERFAVPVGWSDHTQDVLTALGAVALGASLLEKHLTVDRSRPGPDHAASSDPVQFADYVERVRRMESALGDGRKRPVPSEEANRLHARRSWHAARALLSGQVLATSDVQALRPATGLSPSLDVIGRRVRRAVAAGRPLMPEDLEPAEDAGS